MQPNNLLLPVETDPEKCALLHGTTSKKLAQIAREGLRPRHGRRGSTNWSKHPSHPKAVYLTTAYAMHYGYCAAADGDFITILDIDVASLGRETLVADEDSYATARVEGFEWVQELSLPDRVAYWRNNLKATDAAQSLRVLGNCACMGSIAPAAIKAVRLLSRQEVAMLTVGVCDPVIHPMNFKLMGGYFQRFNAWLVGRDTVADGDLVEWFSRVCTPAMPVMTLDEAAAYMKKTSAK